MRRRRRRYSSGSSNGGEGGGGGGVGGGGVDGAEVGVFEEGVEVSIRGLLHSGNGGSLEAEEEEEKEAGGGGGGGGGGGRRQRTLRTKVALVTVSSRALRTASEVSSITISSTSSWPGRRGNDKEK